MSAREQLHEYLRQLRRRLRLHATLRGAATLLLTALLATVALVAIANRQAFSGASVEGSRATLLALLAAVAILALALPLRRLTSRGALQRAERRFPEFNQRLATFADRQQSPFAELLAADTLAFTRSAPPASFAPDSWLYGALGLGLACLGILVWLIAAGPGYWGYGASLLWTGPRAHSLPLYSIEIKPGNASVRRHSDLLITALTRGLASPEVQIFARYGAAAAWQAAAMRPQAGAPGYSYLFPAVPQDFDYYAVAGPLHSSVYHVKVRDLPVIKQIAVTYHYPAWTGLPDVTHAQAGDLSAVAGTTARLTIATDQPLSQGTLELNPGQPIQLQPLGNNRYQASLPMQQDGVYHVATRLPGDDVSTRLSEDYFIAAPPPAPPQVALVRPGRDYRASPIEEVTVAAQASDPFGLKSLELHYSINGGAETTVPLLPHSGAKSADGKSTISFESFHAQPGDLVSVYASARDGRAESRSDILFIQADPFERDFSQSQQSGAGAGGGQGNISAQIADREKEIIAQTFKQQHTQAFTAAADKLASDTSKLLSASQSTLHDQALSLSGRMDSRELTGENQAFTEFQQDMVAAAQAMAPAASSLSGQKWSAALPNEEKALRNLLRADATFRQIEIAFGSRGGGGGGGSSAGRDLASMFNLELDNQKNQYETQPTASTAEQKAQAINDTLQKLDQLAQRQQQMAQPSSPQQAAEQRWQQDLLRREAQQLQQQLQQLAQNAASAASASSSSASSSSPSSSSSSASSSQNSSQAASQSNAAASTQAALNRLREANQAMQRAASPNESPAQAAADARQAAEALRQARDALARLQQQTSGDRLAGMASQATQLAQQQKQQADQVRQFIASHKEPTQQQMSQLIQGRQQVSNQFDQLEKQLRSAARDLNSTQPGASGKVRSALDAADGSDLGTRLQRSADWLRNGDFSDANESALTRDLQQLGQNLQQAQRALGNAQASASNAALAGAMQQLESLRQQIARLGGNASPNSGQNPSGRAGDGNAQAGQLANGGNRQAGSRGGANQSLGANSGARNGYNSGRVGNAAGGYRYQYGNGGYDLGNTHIVGQAVAPQVGPNPADTQRAIQQDLDALNRLRPDLPQDADTQRAIQDLIRMTRGLDPSRFPGNPAMLADMHQQLLSSVDALELQIRKKLDDSQGGQIRGRAPEPAPAGYDAAVAAYFRKLSGGH